ncbi:MAG: glycosyltransferase family 2 protein [Ferruginibacter sp.]
MNLKPSFIQPPTSREKKVLRLMIFIGLVAILFFLYTMMQKKSISNTPLYILLMVTMCYYCLKFLHEWYHYFSISAGIKPVTTRVYAVDILTTYCPGEPFEMLEETLTAIQKITYPHTAWCCDEADDPKVKQLCARLGVRHVTRTIKKNAKAGNINNALQYATGELCVVLDPDHVPAPEFLDEVVSYFDDASIGFVQIVQAYYNQHESLVAKGAAQQTYQFYGPMMMAMHSYGTVQAIGANCTFRRSALDSIGGHASGLSEDMHTAMQLHAKGWRSIYVPAILTRGLVPATMSSYYKQQLKWSRGTWELLLLVYPKLFRKFTWRQKLHYFTLPFHYLSGLIFFINFLIPVISLFTGYVPLKMDMVSFLLATLPAFTMSILIRHYVQKWVAEERERGFHLVGGVLQIGTWWIHSIGFFYTLIRKKVPYIPTPKNDNDPLPLILNLPNFLIAAISLSAIIYGLYWDYNPYTIFMVLLACMQIFFMVFIFFISGYKKERWYVNSVARKVRKKTWLIIQTHGILRRYSLPLAFVVIISFVFAYRQQQLLPVFLPKPLPGLHAFYYGLKTGDSLNDNLKRESALAVAAGRKDIAIISANIPWGKGEKDILDTAFLQKIYSQQAVPLLAWQPFQQGNDRRQERDTNVFVNIVKGKYDDMILAFARQVIKLNKPVYLCYNNQPIKNKYPLFSPVKCNPDNYVAAWKYIHQQFEKAGGNKVIWVWKPWDTASVAGYYPGPAFVDWLGVDNLDLGSDPSKTAAISFDYRYRPYHLLPVFRSGPPVMITQLKSNRAGAKNWWKATWDVINTDFEEIRSVVIEMDNESNIKSVSSAVIANSPKASLPVIVEEQPIHTVDRSKVMYKLPGGIKSVVYDNGYNWFRNRHTLNSKIIESNLLQMKKIGINTIERTMPGFYDKTLKRVIASNGVNLIPRFWLAVNEGIIMDTSLMYKQKEKILSVVKENLGNKNVIAWSVGDDVLYRLSKQTYYPDYFYLQETYTKWLSELCVAIRSLDTSRPIVIDLHWDEKGASRLQYYKAQVPQINTYMLETDPTYLKDLDKPLPEGLAWGKVSVDLWPLIPAIKRSGTIPAWQDIENTDYITLNGLLDLDGRKKYLFDKVVNLWGDHSAGLSAIPDIRILKPAETIYENTTHTYHLLQRGSNERWEPGNDDLPGIHFEWYLLRVDQYGNTLYIKKKGEGNSLSLFVPNEPKLYKLYVEAVSGNNVKYAFATLHTPLE